MNSPLPPPRPSQDPDEPPEWLLNTVTALVMTAVMLVCVGVVLLALHGLINIIKFVF